MGKIVIPKKRSDFLSVMLFIFALPFIGRCLSIIFPELYSDVYSSADSWFYIYNVITFIVGIIGLIATLKWHIWGTDIIELVIFADLLANRFGFNPPVPWWHTFTSLLLLILFSFAAHRDKDKFLPYPFTR